MPVGKSGGLGVLSGILGWLLLVSPAGKHPVPMSKWSSAGTYATEDSCEYEKELQMTGAHAMFPNRGEEQKREPHQLTSSSISACVSEDDPRLK
jgi:hypothetical protein